MHWKNPSTLDPKFQTMQSMFHSDLRALDDYAGGRESDLSYDYSSLLEKANFEDSGTFENLLNKQYELKEARTVYNKFSELLGYGSLCFEDEGPELRFVDKLNDAMSKSTESKPKRAESNKISKNNTKSSNSEKKEAPTTKVPIKIFKEDEDYLAKLDSNIRQMLGELEEKDFDFLDKVQSIKASCNPIISNENKLYKILNLHSERNELLRSMGKPEFKLNPELERSMGVLNNHMRTIYKTATEEKNRSKENYKKHASNSGIARNKLEGKVEEDLLDKFHKNREECKKLAELLGEPYYSSGEEWNIYKTKPLIGTEAIVEISKCVGEKIKSIDVDDVLCAVELIMVLSGRGGTGPMRTGLTICRAARDLEVLCENIPSLAGRASDIIKSEDEVGVKTQKFLSLLKDEGPAVLARLSNLRLGAKNLYGTASDTLGFANEKVKEGSRGWLHFGKNKVCRDKFHKEIKATVLGNCGDFLSKVGDNPNITVVNKKIVLLGQGPFKNKKLETNLLAKDYFE